MMPRQARLDAPGTLHHVIVRGIERRRIVGDDEDRRRFVGRLGELARETGTQVYAWSLMPNHVHLLVRSGSAGLPGFMRRLLTGYAVTYNRRHRRHGHLFQNRYKSIVCDEDSYFTELVRYIHLNPLRAKLVPDLGALDRYAWSGHAAVTGSVPYPWQDTAYLLGFFGQIRREAVRSYRRYVGEGIALGRRPDLVGGGLVRSLGGWSAVASLRRSGERRRTDERILGSGDFVERVIQEAEEKTRREFSRGERKGEVRRLIESACRKAGVSVGELRSGSRRGSLGRLRSSLACEIVAKVGMPLADVARELGVSTSAVCKALSRHMST
jgi:REP element-mobilizing transposase RayT